MCGCSKQPQDDRYPRSQGVRYFYWLIVVALVLTVLGVLFVPGADDLVEQIFQRYLGSAAR